MRIHGLRLLAVASVAVVLIVIGAFFTDWFLLHFAGQTVHVDLREARMCTPECMAVPVAHMPGAYPTLAALAFWTAMPLFVIVATQAGSRLLTGVGYKVLARLGMALGVVVLLAAFGAGFLVSPDGASFAGFALVTVDRMWGPLVLVFASLASIVTVRYAAVGLEGEPEDESAYEPAIPTRPLDTHERERIPVTPLSVNRLPTPVRAKAPTAPPPATTLPLPPDVGMVVRTRPPTQPPTSTPVMPALASALGMGAAPSKPVISPAPLPPPEPTPVPGTLGVDDVPDATPQATEPVAPAPAQAAQTIRAAAGSNAGITIPSIAGAPRAVRTQSEASARLASALAAAKRVSIPPKATAPDPSGPAIKYVVTTASFSGDGIVATREDSFSRLIKWSEVVGIVARRLPPGPPYDGETFVDVVSTAGATLRFLARTDISGHTFASHPVERARALVQLLAVQCLEAKLDAATRTFAAGSGNAGQLKDAAQLAVHDARLA